jgi:hypothetical protein
MPRNFFRQDTSFPNTRPLPTRPCSRHHTKLFIYLLVYYDVFSTSGYNALHLKVNNELETLLHKSINSVPIL